MNILETIGLTKLYGSGETQVRALDGIDLTVERGEFVAVVGSSGSGKSTFLNMVGGLDVPTSGEVIVDQKRLRDLTDDELTVFRRRKIGFVFQQYNLIPMLTVWENIILLLADEPTVNLDSRTSQDVLGLLKITGRKFDQTVVMITHNEEIAQLADRIVRIEDGRLVKGGES